MTTFAGARARVAMSRISPPRPRRGLVRGRTAPTGFRISSTTQCWSSGGRRSRKHVGSSKAGKEVKGKVSTPHLERKSRWYSVQVGRGGSREGHQPLKHPLHPESSTFKVKLTRCLAPVGSPSSVGMICPHSPVNSRSKSRTRWVSAAEDTCSCRERISNPTREKTCRRTPPIPFPTLGTSSRLRSGETGPPRFAS